MKNWIIENEHTLEKEERKREKGKKKNNILKILLQEEIRKKIMMSKEDADLHEAAAKRNLKVMNKMVISRLREH